MGKLIEYALEQAADMGQYMSKAAAFAFMVERALEAANVEVASIYLATPEVTVYLNTPELQADRAYITAVRRALGVPKAIRTFDKTSGTFTFTGESTRLFAPDGKPLSLKIRAGAAGCKVIRYTSTREVTEYAADCDPSVEELTDG